MEDKNLLPCQKLLAVSRKLEDLELAVVARARARRLIAGEDRLIPLDDVMREYGISPGAHPDEDHG